MRKLLFIFLISLEQLAFSQHLIQGSISDEFGELLPGVKIKELGTENDTISTLEGAFSFFTIQDTCKINFSWISLNDQTVTVSSDTILNIVLINDFYNTRWLTIGANYNIYSSVYDIHLSNGFDERGLIHFEDFQDSFIIKINGQLDFQNNYAYGIEAGWGFLIPNVYQVTIGYNFRDFESIELMHKDTFLSAKIGFIRNTLFVFKTGYQELNNNRNIGANLGVEQIYKDFYLGFSSGYYADYFHHQVYAQAKMPFKRLISIRAIYDRIKNFNLLSFGVHYSFVRN